jgi:hypothetical protein
VTAARFLRAPARRPSRELDVRLVRALDDLERSGDTGVRCDHLGCPAAPTETIRAPLPSGRRQLWFACSVHAPDFGGRR